jgi:hypothetical protein
MADQESFAEIFAALKPVLTPYARRLAVKDDKPGHYYLETKTAVYKGRPMAFAAIRTGKAYVSFHLVPIYMNPKLKSTISPGLQKRMQGKACFNFTKVEPSHIAELKKLTKAGFEQLKNWPAQFGSP